MLYLIGIHLGYVLTWEHKHNNFLSIVELLAKYDVLEGLFGKPKGVPHPTNLPRASEGKVMPLVSALLVHVLRDNEWMRFWVP